MTKKPTIFLKKDWGRLGTGGYPVVAFSDKGISTFYNLAEKSKAEECWIVVVASKNRKVKTPALKGCFICLVKFEYTEHPQPTLKHITKAAANEPHRLDESGNFIWQNCVRIKGICFAEKPYVQAGSIISDMWRYHGRTVSGFDELIPQDRDAVLNFFNNKNFKWLKI